MADETARDAKEEIHEQAIARPFHDPPSEEPRDDAYQDGDDHGANRTVWVWVRYSPFNFVNLASTSDGTSSESEIPAISSASRHAVSKRGKLTLQSRALGLLVQRHLQREPLHRVEREDTGVPIVLAVLAGESRHTHAGSSRRPDALAQAGARQHAGHADPSRSRNRSELPADSIFETASATVFFDPPNRFAAGIMRDATCNACSPSNRAWPFL